MPLRNKSTLALIAGLAVVGIASAAQAFEIFDFRGSQSTAPSFAFSSGGIQASATGLNESGTAIVDRDGNGLGVLSYQGDNDQIDGYGQEETLRLVFSVPVHVLGVKFALADGPGDDFDLSVNGRQLVDDNSAGNGWWVASLGVIFTPGTVFDFSADYWDDDYKVTQLWVTSWDGKADGAAPVPEPSAALVFGVGLLIVRAAARRR